MNEKIANSVREHRRNAGLTQEKLAHEMNVSRQTINSIERGHYIPSLPLALKIVRFFGCSLEDVFQLEEDTR